MLKIFTHCTFKRLVRSKMKIVFSYPYVVPHKKIGPNNIGSY